MNGSYVLENKKGQVVRVLSWEADRAFVLYRQDTRRIQAVGQLAELDDQDVPYDVLAEVSKEDVKKKPVKIGDVGYLKFCPEIKTLGTSVELPEEDPEAFKKVLKKTSVLALILLLVLVGGSFLIKPAQQEEQNVVTVIPREEIQKIVTPHPPKHHVQNTVAQKATRKRIKSPIAQIKKVTRPSHQASLNNMGALAVLGSLKSSPNKGGLQVNAVNTTRGPGLGGTGGSGGLQTSLYAKGLISAPLGPGARVNGAGGYGKHGAGGGQAGYGKMSLVGSSTAYFEPVQSDAIIEGGLDRAQIAEVIQRHLGQVRYCYEQGLQASPVLKGRVAIRFLINAGGHVSVANITSSSLHAQSVENCIVERLRGWKFPQPRGGVIVKVNYPFVLKRVSQG